MTQIASVQVSNWFSIVSITRQGSLTINFYNTKYLYSLFSILNTNIFGDTNAHTRNLIQFISGYFPAIPCPRHYTLYTAAVLSQTSSNGYRLHRRRTAIMRESRPITDKRAYISTVRRRLPSVIVSGCDLQIFRRYLCSASNPQAII